MSFKLYSHPGILLKNHLEGVVRTGLSRFEENGLYKEDYLLLKIILSFHDLGKASSFFQEYLLHNNTRSKLNHHSEFSALWAYQICSQDFKLDYLSCLIAYITIKSHHLDLDNIKYMLISNLDEETLLKINDNIDYDELNSIYNLLDLNVKLDKRRGKELVDLLNNNVIYGEYKKIKNLLNKEEWVRIYYFFSLLIWADKDNAIFNNNRADVKTKRWKSYYVYNFKDNLNNSGGIIDKIRNEAFREVPINLKEGINIYSINMPTGTGKTLTSLNVALKLMEKNKNLQRIIYSLPFISIIDQNEKVFKEILKDNSIAITSDIILAHHHLSDLCYKLNDQKYSIDKSEFLIETWDSELIVTTFVQLLASCLSTRNNNLKRFHRLANSIIILDEVQNIPHKYWPLLKYVFNLLSFHLNSTIIFVTATLPLIYDPILELANKKKEWFKQLNRFTIDISLLSTPINLEDLANIIIKDYLLNNKPRRLVIMNTIESSIGLYNILKNKLPQALLIYLSSNVIPKHRLERIERIKDKKENGLLIISTQVVEAGVDIDVDIVYRDLAPLDSIIQAAGRCNRNYSKSQGYVILFQLKDKNIPYWKYIYDETLIDATLQTLNSENKDCIPESDLQNLSDYYYNTLKNNVTSDVSKEIINNLSLLNFSYALCYDAKSNPMAFNLIESLSEKNVFVQIDEYSSKLFEDYQKLLNSTSENIYEWKSQLREQFRKMSPYIITVNKKYIPSDESLFIVTKELLNNYYDNQTGFKRISHET